MSPYPWPAFGPRPLLGANGTEAMQALLSDAASLVDYLKVGPFMARDVVAELAAHYPLMLHLDENLGNHSLPRLEKVQPILDWIALTGTPWTSAHIGFRVAGITLHESLAPQAAPDVLTRAEALANIVGNARALAQALPVPLLLENIPLFPNLAYLGVSEPEFVAEVIEATGCNLLLDLAHARVTANVLGCTVEDYLAKLPLERTIELHLSGPRPNRMLGERMQTMVRESARSIAGQLPFDDDSLVDAHAPLQEEDYALLEAVLRRAEPKAISLEYYREPVALREQLVRLGQRLGRGVVSPI